MEYNLNATHTLIVEPIMLMLILMADTVASPPTWWRAPHAEAPEQNENNREVAQPPSPEQPPSHNGN